MINIVGIDIGGSHITSALVDASNYSIKENSFVRNRINSSGPADEILKSWLDTIKQTICKSQTKPCKLAFAMPGPFDYSNGISLIKNLCKYDSLYGTDVKGILSKELGIEPDEILFRNDAEAFLAGEIEVGNYNMRNKILGITLGTGLGSAFSHNGITQDANLAVNPFLNGIAEEYLSTRWFARRFNELSGKTTSDVKDMLSQDGCQDIISEIFSEFTENFTSFLISIIRKEKCETIILGGNITKASGYFLQELHSNLLNINSNIKIHLAQLGEFSAIIGASILFKQTTTEIN